MNGIRVQYKKEDYYKNIFLYIEEEYRGEQRL